MKNVRVAAAVLNQTPLAWDENRQNIIDAIDVARRDGVLALCLPEMCITGYGCEDAFSSIGTLDMAWTVLQEILPHTRGMIVSLGLPVLYKNAVFNCAAMVCDGRLLGLTAKQNLAGDGLHYEPRWFRPWPPGTHDEVEIDGARYPIGDLCYDCGGLRVGFEICEDAWVAERPGAALARQAVDVIFNPSASHFAFDKIATRHRFVIEGSRAFGVTYLYSNLLGNEGGRILYDGGALIASAGDLIAAGGRFSYEPFGVTAATVDVDATRMKQARTASYRPNLTNPAVHCVHGDLELEAPEIDAFPLDVATWEQSDRVKEEEFSRAISLALFDYLRKSRTRGFVVSLSGGADSAAVSSLCAMMLHLAEQELGPDGVRRRLPQLESIDVASLLTCVYQSTRNSSETTLSSARDLAAGLGATFIHLDVDAVVQSYVSMVQDAMRRELSWETDDVALQNVQARARAPGVWMIANLKSALLLSTSNRSEAAVGYATMDGDTCGGLSPIAGIDKAFLRRWLRWLEHEGPDGWSVPTLAAVNALAPTAELRPPDALQTDEDDLMPYPVLDAIERAAIRDKLPPRETYLKVRADLEDHDPEQLARWVEKFYRLWCNNQWKRERYAPSFHVDDENLDPKTWCRFPILSGGFRRELEELRAELEAKGP